MTDEWRVWWQEAEGQQETANYLLAAARWSHAVFHSLMALELAAKAVRMACAFVGNLDMSIESLGNYTIDQLGGMPRKKGRAGHKASDQLDAPWHLEREVKTAEELLGTVEAVLGLTSGMLYEACRYPDRWPGGNGAPLVLISEVHARAVLLPVKAFLTVCRDHLRFALDSDETDDLDVSLDVNPGSGAP